MMPDMDRTVRILTIIAGVSQAYVGVLIIHTMTRARRKDSPAHRLADLDNVASGVVYGSGRIALGVGVLMYTVKPLPWLLVGAFLLMFGGPFIARRIARRFCRRSSMPLGGATPST